MRIWNCQFAVLREAIIFTFSLFVSFTSQNRNSDSKLEFSPAFFLALAIVSCDSGSAYQRRPSNCFYCYKTIFKYIWRNEPGNLQSQLSIRYVFSTNIIKLWIGLTCPFSACSTTEITNYLIPEWPLRHQLKSTTTSWCTFLFLQTCVC